MKYIKFTSCKLPHSKHCIKENCGKIRDKKDMGLKRKTMNLGWRAGYQTHRIICSLYILGILLFIVTCLGNIMNIGTKNRWRKRVIDFMSLNYPTENLPLPLPDCNRVNASTYEKTVMMFVNDDSLHQNVSFISTIKKIFLDNEESLTRLNKKLLHGINGYSNFEKIHSIFRDILLTRTLESTYKANVVRDILPQVKKQMIEHQRTMPTFSGVSSNPLEKYKSCAVVGNSGVLHNSFKGEEIDNHKMVIRINNAMSRNMNKTTLKAHVGTKTTLIFMNSHIMQKCLKRYGYCNCHPYGIEVPIMVYLCIPDHAISVACCLFQHQSRLFLTDGRFDAFVSRIAVWYSLKHFLDSGQGNLTQWEKAHNYEFHYSSGFQAVIVALALCDNVDLYGFGKRPNARHHFHSFQKKEHIGHDFEGEYLFYDELAANQIYENPFLCQAGISIPEVRIFH